MKKIICFMLAFVICFSCMVVPSFAVITEETMPELPDYYLDYDAYLTTSANDSDLSLWLVNKVNDSSTSNFIVREGTGVPSPAILTLEDEEGNRLAFDTYIYKCFISTGEWYKANEVLNKTELNMSNFSNLNPIVGTFDVYDKDGNAVFPPAPTELYQIIQKMTTPEVTKAQTTVVGAMKILALCGVGCLALLMVLPLFGKVLNRYR